MSTLISLVGEQPEPIIIPTLYLNPENHIWIHTPKTKSVADRLDKFFENGQLLDTSDYNFEQVYLDVLKSIKSDEEYIYNITGGTKIMLLATYAVALQSKAKIIYYQGERFEKYLLRLTPDDKGMLHSTKEIVPPIVADRPLFSVKKFLKAYMDLDEREMDKKKNKSEPFEKAIAKALEEDFEIMTNVIPAQSGKQIEIDLILRHGLQFAIAEIKNADKKGDSIKKGVSQLFLAAPREFLGTFTTKILIIGRTLADYHPQFIKEVNELKNSRRLKIVQIPDWSGRQESLSPKQKKDLIINIKEILEPPIRP